MILYAAIDLLGGRCVRPAAEGEGRAGLLEDDPLAVARRWQAAGAPWLHVVDLDGARDGKPAHGALVRAIADATGLPLQFAGGLRTEEDVAETFAQGATRVVLDTTAAHDGVFLAACLARWPEGIAVSLDARGDAVTVAGWLASAVETVEAFAHRMAESGVRTLVMASVERDGSLTGGASPRLLRLRAALPAVTLIAAGGIMTLDDVRRLAEAGINGAVLGRALYEGRLDLGEAIRVAAQPPADGAPLPERQRPAEEASLERAPGEEPPRA